MSQDRIEKHIVLNASIDRVWRAISDAEQFGKWFGVSFDGSFVIGTKVTGRIKPTIVDPEVAKMQKPHEGKPFTFQVERIEPMNLIMFRWHPFAVDSKVDYSKEPMTLIEFRLKAVGNQTELSLVESGFDSIPAERRAEAWRANEGGWTHQVKLIEKYLAMNVS